VIGGRDLQRDELEALWRIDRSEVIANVYHAQDGGLVLMPEYHNMTGWLPGEEGAFMPLLLECFERAGWFYGLFDEGTLIGAAVLESKFIGKNKDRLQLKFLYVSSACRRQGLGQKLSELARLEARTRGAKGLYISATPSENTINFYLRLGCTLTLEPDPELFELEPEDIHLECAI
jgi:GNAT superfamily N-acetyltransferase